MKNNRIKAIGVARHRQKFAEPLEFLIITQIEFLTYILSYVKNGCKSKHPHICRKGAIKIAPVLLSGGNWNNSSNCGSCSLNCNNSRLNANVNYSVRAVSKLKILYKKRVGDGFTTKSDKTAKQNKGTRNTIVKYLNWVQFAFGALLYEKN